VIEITVEPFVNGFVNGMVVITNFLGSLSFSQGLSFSGSTILIGTTDIQSVVTSETAPSGIDISTQDTANNISQVRNIIDVRKSTGNQDIFLIFTRKDDFSLVNSIDLAFFQDFLNLRINFLLLGRLRSRGLRRFLFNFLLFFLIACLLIVFLVTSLLVIFFGFFLFVTTLSVFLLGLREFLSH